MTTLNLPKEFPVSKWEHDAEIGMMKRFTNDGSMVMVPVARLQNTDDDVIPIDYLIAKLDRNAANRGGWANP